MENLNISIFILFQTLHSTDSQQFSTSSFEIKKKTYDRNKMQLIAKILFKKNYVKSMLKIKVIYCLKPSY